MQSNQLVLTVGACAHALGTAQQDTHLTGTHLCKQVLFLCFTLGIMDVGNLLFGDAHIQQLITNVIVDILKRSHSKTAIFLFYHLNRSLFSRSR